MITVRVEMNLDGAEGLDVLELHNALAEHLAGEHFYVRGVRGAESVVIDEVGPIETVTA